MGGLAAVLNAHPLIHLIWTPGSVEMEIGDGARNRVLDLETPIAIKEELGGDKDRAMLPVLRRTLEETRRL